MVITITDSANNPPSVDAGGDQTVSEGSTVNLDATVSDPDSEDTLTYFWTHNSTLTITFADDVEDPSFTAPNVDSDTAVEFTLTVHDGTAPVSDGVVITITDRSAGAFVTTWNAASSPHTIAMPLEVHAGGMLTIDWGDGSSTSVTENGTQSHAYPDSGEYQVSMTGGLSRIILGNAGATASKLASIDQWGDIRWSSMESAFQYATGMTHDATDAPDLSGVSSMHYMFNSASKFDGNLSNWDVSSVTDMSGAFLQASAFNGDVSGWDVSAVTNMQSMFQDASLFNQPLNDWDISGVNNMAAMFSGVTSFNQPLNSWDVSSVTSMKSMFDGAFDQNLGEWYVVPDDSSIARSDVPGIIGEISAQNGYLDSQSPAYGIGTGGDSTLFEIASGTKLNMTSVTAKSSYGVNVTASGSNVFEDGNNWRMLDVTVTGQADADQVLDPVGAQNVNELVALSFTATATDGDNGALEFSLAGTPPSGASITSDGAFSWTPSESQDGSHSVTVRVSDGNGGIDSETFTVSVAEVNVAPVLDLIGPRSVNLQETLSFTATASDDDVIGGVADTLSTILVTGSSNGSRS